jgi:hypothetical protein
MRCDDGAAATDGMTIQQGIALICGRRGRGTAALRRSLPSVPRTYPHRYLRKPLYKCARLDQIDTGRTRAAVKKQDVCL